MNFLSCAMFFLRGLSCDREVVVPLTLLVTESIKSFIFQNWFENLRTHNAAAVATAQWITALVAAVARMMRVMRMMRMMMAMTTWRNKHWHTINHHWSCVVMKVFWLGNSFQSNWFICRPFRNAWLICVN